MKRLILSSLLLATISFGTTNCTKEKIAKVKTTSKTETVLVETPKEKKYIDDNDYSQLKLIGNTIEFGSINYYESFFLKSDNSKVDFLIKHLDKLKVNLLKKEKNIEGDDFIKAILDDNGIVKIGKWTIKLNLDAEKVFVSSSENLNAYDLVKNEVISSDLVYEFSFEDEVLMLLKDEDLLTQKRWFKRCKDRKAISGYNKTDVHNIYNFNGVSINAELENKYRKFGIYFTLVSKGILRSTDLNLNSNVTMWFYLSNCSFKVRCNYAVSNYTYPTRYPTNLDMPNSFTMNGTFRWYSGIQQLKYYDYKVKMRIDHTYSSTPPNSFTDIYSQWTRITDY